MHALYQADDEIDSRDNGSRLRPKTEDQQDTSDEFHESHHFFIVRNWSALQCLVSPMKENGAKCDADKERRYLFPRKQCRK